MESTGRPFFSSPPEWFMKWRLVIVVILALVGVALTSLAMHQQQQKLQPIGQAINEKLSDNMTDAVLIPISGVNSGGIQIPTRKIPNEENIQKLYLP